MKKKLFAVLMMFGLVFSFAACGPKNEGNKGLDDATELLVQMYKNASSTTKTAVSKDKALESQIKVGDTTYLVTWTLKETNLQNVELVTNDGVVTIHIKDGMSTTAEDFTLVATISDGTENKVVEFEYTYPRFAPISWTEWRAACEAGSTETVTVKGYVICIIGTGSSKNSVYLTDGENHGFYAYNPAWTDEEKDNLDTLYPAGTEVYVTGTGTVYSGQLEFNKGCSIKKTGGESKVCVPFNATELWAAAQDNKDQSLIPTQNTLVTLNDCILTTIEGSYYYFVCGKTTFNIYDNTYFTTSAEQSNWKKQFKAGQACTITGLVSCYSNQYQIYPVDGNVITNLHAPELTDAEFLDLAKKITTIDTVVYPGVELTLPTKSDINENISISWNVYEDFKTTDGAADTAKADANKALVAVANNKATFTFPEGNAAATAYIQATFHHADLDATADVKRTYEIELVQPTMVTVAEFLAKETTDKTVYGINGWVVANGSTSSANSFVVADATGVVFSYNKFKTTVGDSVLAIGTRSANNGIDQLGTVAVTHRTPADGETSPYDKTKAVALDATTEFDYAKLSSTVVAPWSGKLVKVTGVVATKDGNYVNGTIGGTKRVEFYADSSLYNGFENMPVDVYCYVRGFNSNGYIQVQVAELAIAKDDSLDDAGQAEAELGYLAPATSITNTGEYTLPTAAKVYEGVTITWALKAASDYCTVENNKLKVTSLPLTSSNVTLVATATKGDATKTKEFSVSIVAPAVVTVAEFLAKETTDTNIYAIKGWVVANGSKTSANSFVLADATGAIFSYNKFLTTVGDSVTVLATRAVNNGINQLGTISVTHREPDAGETNPYNKANAVALDATTEFDYEALSATVVAPWSGKLVKVTGVVATESGSYVNGTIGGTKRVEFYADSSVYDGFKGQTVDVYCYVRGFSGSNKYIQVQVVELAIPADPNATDADKVSMEKSLLTFSPAEVEAAGSFDLKTTPTVYEGVTITWALKAASTYASINDGKLVVTALPEEDDATITLVATLSSGEANDTKEINVKLLSTAVKYLAAVDTTVCTDSLYVKEGTDLDGTVNLANKLGLDPTKVSFKVEANGCTNGDGQARLHKDGYVVIYDSAKIIFTAENTITKVSISLKKAFTGTINGANVTGAAGETISLTLETPATEVVIINLTPNSKGDKYVSTQFNNLKFFYTAE